jgi:hypothetical protein
LGLLPKTLRKIVQISAGAREYHSEFLTLNIKREVASYI